MSCKSLPVRDTIEQPFREVLHIEMVGLLKPRKRLSGPRQIFQRRILHIIVVHCYVLYVFCNQWWRRVATGSKLRGAHVVLKPQEMLYKGKNCLFCWRKFREVLIRLRKLFYIIPEWYKATFYPWKLHGSCVIGGAALIKPRKKGTNPKIEIIYKENVLGLSSEPVTFNTSGGKQLTLR